MRRKRATTRLVAVAFAVALGGGCTGDASDASVSGATLGSIESSSSSSSTTTSTTTTTSPATTVVPRAACTAPPREQSLDRPIGADVESIIELSRAVLECADAVVLIDTAEPRLLADASSLASAIDAPLFPFVDGQLAPELVAEIDRLDPSRIRVYGDIDTSEVFELAPAIDRIVPPGFPQSPTTYWLAQAEALATTHGNDDVVVELRPDVDRRAELVTIAPLMNLGGADVIAVDPLGDEKQRRKLQTLAESGATIHLPDDVDETDRWRVELAIAGTELPGGGIEVFPNRRLIALYGNPLTSALGVLGEQDPPESLELLDEIISEYQRPGQPPIQPAFEIIASVAAGSPTENGDYSRELSVEQLQDWVDFASANDVFVLLDLQPGRDDFLTQAQQYEALLVLPNVGLALDPEWRLGPDELPLRRVGTVSADEVNQVVQWLAELVRDNTLPQKPLVLHQFQRRMLQERERIETPPELAVVVHIDGQGSLASKYATWNSMQNQARTSDQTLWWGWKNFYDEDRPMATPDQVNDLEPLPLVVTFQ